MERISLPTRTVTTRGWVAVTVAAAVILLTVLWTAHVLVVGFVAPYMFRDFRRVVVTGDDIVRAPRGEPEVWTLFVEQGRMHSLEPAAQKACFGLDLWNGSMRYLYAQAVWRDYNATPTTERAPSGRSREALPGETRALLEGAIRCEPMNLFYRQTLLELDIVASPPVAGPEELKLQVEEYAPQDAWGQLRAAECLVKLRDDNKSRILSHYLRSLELVPSVFTSGLLDPRVPAWSSASPRPFGDIIVTAEIGRAHV